MAGVRKLTASDEWAISDKPAHEALVSEADFVAAQTVSYIVLLRQSGGG